VGPDNLIEFNYEFIYTTGSVFYFLFIPSTYDSSNGCFTNFVFSRFNAGKNLCFDSGVSPTWESHWWHELDADFTEGSYSQDVSFDGYTCTDNKNVAYFPNDSGYAFVRQDVAETRQLTVEFWHRT